MAESDFTEILEKIANNPDVIEKLTSITQSTAKDSPQEGLSKIMDAISPLINQISSEGKVEKSDTPPSKTDEPPLSVPLAKLGEKITKNSKLLMALKPYLSRERCEIIDTIVKIAQVGDLMKLVK